MPIVSVIVPVYNVEQYLPRCIDSILGQTFTDFELILVDDGSPDHCGVICDAYAKKDPRVKVIHQKNAGVSAARNAALATAMGEYITFVDSDDYIGHDRLETMYTALIRENADVVITNMTIIDEDGSTVKQVMHREFGTVDMISGEEKKKYICTKLLACVHGWEVWTRLFRRDIIRDNCICFPETCGNYAEDMAFVAAYMLYARCMVSITYAGYFYMLRSDSMMRKSEGTVKLDSLNEVSKWLYPYYCAAMDTDQEFPIMHFLLCNTEYGKIIGDAKQYSRLGCFLNSIKDQAWYVRQNASLRKCNKQLDAWFGKRVRQQIGLFCHYCAHQNWKRYTYESAIAYRWLIARE